MSVPNSFRKNLGRLTLLLLILLAGLKYYLGGCRLWLCMAFVGVVVAYTILSDVFGNQGHSDKMP